MNAISRGAGLSGVAHNMKLVLLEQVLYAIHIFGFNFSFDKTKSRKGLAAILAKKVTFNFTTKTNAISIKDGKLAIMAPLPRLPGKEGGF